VIFATTARDNLRYGRWDADDDAIWAAAEAANAAGFLRALPDGLDTFLGEAGARLSGGQRQRIAIACALACDPEVLLADEPTTALDVTVQAGILRLLRDLATERNLAVLLVTHDLGVMSAIADEVAVMKDGRIVERADRETLFLSPQHEYTRTLLAALPGSKIEEAPEGEAADE
jgi:ABC-type dipeptide/oligopeptide/nickel transport system ATPase component